MALISEEAIPTVEPTLTESQVAAFLHDHPDFLLRHPQLAADMAIPSRWPDGGRVVDLQAFAIDRLRDELHRVRGAAEDLIHTSHSNMSTQTRTHQAVLALLRAQRVSELALVIQHDLPAFLDVDMAVLCFEGQGAFPGVRNLPVGAVDILIGPSDCALNEEMPGEPVVFGEAAPYVASSALVRLQAGPLLPTGLLALGSRHGCTFHPCQATDLIMFLARVIELTTRRFLS
jgi:uncharacterized protein